MSGTNFLFQIIVDMISFIESVNKVENRRFPPCPVGLQILPQS